MIEQKDVVAAVKELLERAQIEPNAKYITARQIEVLYSIPSKTVLNRSLLESTNPRFIPSLRLRGGRQKYFERKVVERLFCLSNNAKTGGQK